MDEGDRTRLRTYLNDHRAGSIAGMRTARRCARDNRGEALGRYLSEVFIPQLETEKRTLDELFIALELPPNHVKRVLAAAFETVTRLKRKGAPSSQSELTRVIEVEALMSGVTSKRQMWEILLENEAARAAVGSDRLARHHRDATDQIEALIVHHRASTGRAFGE